MHLVYADIEKNAQAVLGYASLYGALPEDLNFLSQANIHYSAD